MNRRLWNRKIKRAKFVQSQKQKALIPIKNLFDLVECQKKSKRHKKKNINFWLNSPHHKYLALAK